MNFRSSAFPRSTLANGKEIIGKPAGFGQQKKDEYTARHYHQPSDEVDPAWDLSGAVQDTQLLFDVGYEVANGDTFPEWKSGSEFNRAKGSASRGH